MFLLRTILQGKHNEMQDFIKDQPETRLFWSHLIDEMCDKVNKLDGAKFAESFKNYWDCKVQASRALDAESWDHKNQLFLSVMQSWGEQQHLFLHRVAAIFRRLAPNQQLRNMLDEWIHTQTKFIISVDAPIPRNSRSILFKTKDLSTREVWMKGFSLVHKTSTDAGDVLTWINEKGNQPSTTSPLVRRKNHALLLKDLAWELMKHKPDMHHIALQTERRAQKMLERVSAEESYSTQEQLAEARRELDRARQTLEASSFNESNSLPVESTPRSQGMWSRASSAVSALFSSSEKPAPPEQQLQRPQFFFDAITSPSHREGLYNPPVVSSSVYAAAPHAQINHSDTEPQEDHAPRQQISSAAVSSRHVAPPTQINHTPHQQPLVVAPQAQVNDTPRQQPSVASSPRCSFPRSHTPQPRASPSVMVAQSHVSQRATASAHLPCTVCQYACQSNQECVKAVPCGHVYHKECLECNMSRGNHICPNCNRHVVSTKSYRFRLVPRTT